MIRYLPPNGTALTARSAVSTLKRSPPPPESTRATVSATTPSGIGSLGSNAAGHTMKRPRPRQEAGPRGKTGGGGLPAHAERDEVGGVEIGVVRKRLVVGRE